MAIVFLLEVDWDDDGFGLGAEDDITTDVISYPLADTGRDYNSQIYGKAIAGKFTAVLRNDDNKYNRNNAASVLFGLVLPGKRIRWRLNVGAGLVTRWEGYLDNVLPRPARGGFHTATLTALGPLSRLTNRRIYSPMTTSILTGTVVTAALDAGDFPAADRAIDAGQTTIGRWFSNRQLIHTAIRDVEETEGGFFRETNDGKLAFEDRNHRLAGAHLTSQVTLRDTTTGVSVKGIAPEDPLKDVANIIRAQVRSYTVGTLAVLWTLQETPSLNVGESRTFVAEYPQPDTPPENVGVDAWTTPAANVDYTGNTQANGGGTDRTADLGVTVVKAATTMDITIINNHATDTVFIRGNGQDNMESRGTPVTAIDPVTIEVRDQTSIDDFGPRDYLLPAPFLQDTSDAKDYGDFVLKLQKDVLPKATAVFEANVSTAHEAEAANRQVSDRVTLAMDGDSGLDLNEDFYVERLTYNVTEGGVMTVKEVCSPASVYSDIIILDTGPALGTGILGR